MLRLNEQQEASTMPAENPRTVDLFAGVGGLSLGFIQAGFNVVAAYDNWDRAIDVYGMNFRHPAFKLDLSETERAIDSVEKHEPQVVIGGPPCQDFSSAGKRIERGNASLTESFAEIAVAVQPQLIVMENVARARASQAYRNARDLIAKHGYGITECTLDASLCGVPQRRKRFFAIAVRGKPDGLLDNYLSSALASDALTVREYLGEEIDTSFYYRHPRNYSRRAVYSLEEPSATIRGVNRPIPPNYPGHPLDAAPVSRARPLTTKERSRIQTFPPDWIWSGTKTDVEQMIGNAVPVALAKFVAQGVRRYGH